MGKLETFIQGHFRVGELYTEFMKKSCNDAGTVCDFSAQGWVGPILERGPMLYPDHDCLPEFHYKPMEEMPRDVREVCDYQPRVRINIMVKQCTLSSIDRAGIKQFSKSSVYLNN